MNNLVSDWDRLKLNKLKILVLLGFDIDHCQGFYDVAGVVYDWTEKQGIRSELEDLMFDWQVMWIQENVHEVAEYGWCGIKQWNREIWIRELADYLNSLAADDDFILILKGLKGEVNVTNR